MKPKLIYASVFALLMHVAACPMRAAEPETVAEILEVVGRTQAGGVEASVQLLKKKNDGAVLGVIVVYHNGTKGEVVLSSREEPLRVGLGLFGNGVSAGELHPGTGYEHSPLYSVTLRRGESVVKFTPLITRKFGESIREEINDGTLTIYFNAVISAHRLSGSKAWEEEETAFPKITIENVYFKKSALDVCAESIYRGLGGR